MLKIMKYLKKSAVSVVAIIILLLVQALCDISLPDYTSKIVNVGNTAGWYRKCGTRSYKRK